MAQPANEGMWLGFGETLMLVTGGWILLGSLSGQDSGLVLRSATGARGLRLARLLYAVALPMVWLPGIAAHPATRLPWTAFFVSAAITGAAWVVAGSLQGAAWGLARRTAQRRV